MSNNSKLAIEYAALKVDEVRDRKPDLREQEAQILKIIEAIHGVKSSIEWSTLKTELFDGLAESLRKELLSESKKEIPDQLKLRNLAGQLKWAESYADLDTLANTFRVRLTNVRKSLYGTT